MYKEDVPAKATASPRCVRRGGTVTLKVETEPEAAVAYGAKYADGQYGAAPPFGKGYGGSGHGTADQKGRWTTTWTVAATAPDGPAVVDVIVGYRGKQGSAHPAFTVARVDGSC
jgi:hypothetical protein